MYGYYESDNTNNDSGYDAEFQITDLKGKEQRLSLNT